MAIQSYSLHVKVLDFGSFENEDRCTKHPNFENEALKPRKLSTQISKTKYPRLETTEG